MGAYWRGEITARQLRVLIEQLPPRSALHRARNDGHEWGNTEAVLWRIEYWLKVLDQRLMWQKGKRPKWPKWLQFPWSKNQVQLGDRGGRSPLEVKAYLDSLSPKNNPVPAVAPVDGK